MTKPIVGIHEGVNRSFPCRLKRYEKILRHNGISSVHLNCSDINFWHDVKKADLFIYHFVHLDSEMQIAKTLLPILEFHHHITCFPNQVTSWHYDDKIRQNFLLTAYGFPLVDTWVFWDYGSAVSWLKSADFPLVFKLKSGAGSANVILLKDKREALQLVRKIFSDRGFFFGKIPHKNNLLYLRDLVKLYRFRRWFASKRGRLGPEGSVPYWQIHRDYVLFQKFLSGNKYDLRVNIIADKAFAFIRYNRPGDFRASGSGMLEYGSEEIDLRCIRIAFEISVKLKFQCMAYDFIFDEDGKPKIAEISYTFVDEAVYNCPGYFDDQLQWHEGHFWPQFCILDSLLPAFKLKQPPEEKMLNL